MPFDAVFDARTVQPSQGGGKHPVGNKYPFTITDTAVKPVEGKNSGRFEVELTSQVGSIKKNYNLWNESAQAKEIAEKEFSALCHAVGIFTIDFKIDGAALRGARGMMDVGFQAGQQPTAEKPEGGYVEVKKVYDVAGNEPGKAPAQVAQGFAQNPAATQQQPQAQNGFAQQPVQQVQQPAQQQPSQAWQPPAQQPQQQPQQQVAPQGGWQQNPAGIPPNAPWGAPR